MEKQECKIYIRPIRDVIEIIGSKWKLPVIIALSFGNKRFNELERQLEGISPRMLSKELKDLEINGLVDRTVYSTTPVSVEYSLTKEGKSLDKVIAVMREWGQEHRERIMHSRIDQQASAQSKTKV